MSEAARRVALPDFGSGSRPPTTAELESVQARAYSEGWEKGYADGFAAGMQDVKAAAERLEALTAALASPLAAADDAVVEQLRDLALRIGARLARHTLAVDPDAVLGLVRDALEALVEGEGAAHVALHPQDRAGLPEDVALPATVQWHDDPDLPRGDVRVWRGAAGVDAGLDARLDTLARQWLDADQEMEA